MATETTIVREALNGNYPVDPSAVHDDKT